MLRLLASVIMWLWDANSENCRSGFISPCTSSEETMQLLFDNTTKCSSHWNNHSTGPASAWTSLSQGQLQPIPAPARTSPRRTSPSQDQPQPGTAPARISLSQDQLQPGPALARTRTSPSQDQPQISSRFTVLLWYTSVNLAIYIQ